MNISELCIRAHSNAWKKGFYDCKKSLPELAMLLVTEISEMIEADRIDFRAEHKAAEWLFDAETLNDEDKQLFEKKVKNSVEDELADVWIRLADLTESLGIDIERHIRLKMMYNAQREKMHGKRY